MPSPIYRFSLSPGGNIYPGYNEDELPGREMDNDGTIMIYPGSDIYYTSGKLYVEGIPSRLIQFNRLTRVLVSAYDVDDEPLVTWEDQYEYLIPSNAVYVRICTLTAEKGRIDLLPLVPSNPVYGDDLSIEYEKESNQQYFRSKLSGKLVYLKDDYRYIMSRPFDTEFFVVIEKADRPGAEYSPYHQSRFMMTDCAVNEDDLRIEVQTEVSDDYAKVLAGIEKEYNLIELAPEIESVRYAKRPMIQAYIKGESVVSCFLNGTYWEQDVVSEVTDERQLESKYGFYPASEFHEIKSTTLSGDDYSGLFTGNIVENPDSDEDVPNNYDLYGIFRSRDTDAYIEIKHYSYKEGIFTRRYWDYALFSASDRILAFKGNAPSPYDNPDVELSGHTTKVRLENWHTKVYMRYLTDVEEINGIKTGALPIDDIVENNRNYKRMNPYALDLAEISDVFTKDPTPWGRNEDGLYFNPPYNITRPAYFPIGRSSWHYASYWFKFYEMDWVLEEKARKEYTLKDAYPLSSCINVLLREFAPDITHEGTPEYSRFLYGETNPLTGRAFRLVITQKSNVINGEYQTPAQKAPCTLQQLTDMLRNVYKCYWYIEDRKFKIEHISFFMNGGSYDTPSVVGYDLTEMPNVRNRKAWAFATSSYTYEKSSMPQRYEFSWMDDVSQIFNGYPIEVNSRYVQKDRKEEVNVSNFTSDIDLLLLNPSAMSPDGFVLFGAVEDAEGKYVLPFLRMNIDGTEYIIQNCFAAFCYIHPNIWTYAMPSYSLTVNNSPANAHSVDRQKKQNVGFPGGYDDPHIKKLVRTYIGDGEIEKISVNLSSRFLKAALRYDTEQ